MTHFVSINHSCIGKPKQIDHKTASKEEIKAYNASVNRFVNRPQVWTYFTDEQFYATLREYVTVRGHSFASFMGEKMLTNKYFVNENYRQREKSNFAGASYVCLDFDAPKDGTPMVSWEEIQSNLKELGIWENVIFMYATPSYDPKNGKNNCRVVLHIPDELVYINYEHVTKGLLSKFAYADPSCKDASRMWFGTPNCQRVECPEKTVRMSQEKYEYFVALGEVTILKTNAIEKTKLTTTQSMHYDEFTQSPAAVQIEFTPSTTLKTKDGYITPEEFWKYSAADKIACHAYHIDDSSPSAFMSRRGNRVYYSASNDSGIKRCFIEFTTNAEKAFKVVKKNRKLSLIEVDVKNLSQSDVHEQIMNKWNPECRNVVFVESGMGTGKTELLAKMVGEKSTLVVAHLRSLVEDITNRLNLAHYDKISGAKILEEERLGICINSIHRLVNSETGKANKYDLVAVDEITQLSSALNTNTELHDKRITSAHAKVLRNAKNLYFADADLDESMVQFINKFVANKDEKLNIIYVTNSARINQRNITICTSETQVQMEAVRLYNEGHTIYYSVDGNQSTLETKNVLVAAGVPEDAILAINGDTNEEKKLIPNLEDECAARGKRIAVVSPCVRTGVSYPKGYFTQVMGSFNNTARMEISSVNDVAQSVSRCRGSIPLTIYISDAGNAKKRLEEKMKETMKEINAFKGDDEVTRLKIEAAMLKIKALEEEIASAGDEIFTQNYYDRITNRAYQYYENAIKIEEQHAANFGDKVSNEAKSLAALKAFFAVYRTEGTNDVRSKFIEKMTKYGHTISYLEVDPEEEKAFRNLKKLAGTVDDAKASSIMDADDEEQVVKTIDSLSLGRSTFKNLPDDDKLNLQHHQIKEMCEALGTEFDVKAIKKEIKEGNIYKLNRAIKIMSASDDELVEMAVNDRKFKGAEDTSAANIAMKKIALEMMLPYLSNGCITRSVRAKVVGMMKKNPEIFNTARDNKYGMTLVEDMKDGSIKQFNEVMNQIFGGIGIKFESDKRICSQSNVDARIFNLRHNEFKFISIKKREPETRLEKLAAAFA